MNPSLSAIIESETSEPTFSLIDSCKIIYDALIQIDKDVETYRLKELQEINLGLKSQLQETQKYYEKRLKKLDKEVEDYRIDTTEHLNLITLEPETEKIKEALTNYLTFATSFSVAQYFKLSNLESELLKKIELIDSTPLPEEPIKKVIPPQIGCLFLLTFALISIPCMFVAAIPVGLIAGIVTIFCNEYEPSPLIAIVTMIIGCILSWKITKKILTKLAAKKAEKNYEKDKQNWEIEVKNFNEEKEKLRNETTDKLQVVRSVLEKCRSFDIELYKELITVALERLPKLSHGSPVISANISDKAIIVDYLIPDIEDLKDLPIGVTIKRGEISLITQKDTQLSKSYNKLVYDIVLAVIHTVFEEDFAEHIDSVVVNGILDTVDKSIGKRVRICACSLQMNRAEFSELNLDLIDSYECFRRHKGVSAANVADKVAVRPIRQIQDRDSRFVEGYSVATELNRGTNLATMPWQDFENLIRELFEKLFSKHGGSCKVTRASRDGGVDAVAFNPDPISGGKFIIQAKRYTNLVSPSAVRDLYGTLQHEGANKAILVTTSDYGGDSYAFAKDKPIQLLNGSHLLHYLKEELGMTDVYINLEEAKKLNRDV